MRKHDKDEGMPTETGLIALLAKNFTWVVGGLLALVGTAATALYRLLRLEGEFKEHKKETATALKETVDIIREESKELRQQNHDLHIKVFEIIERKTGGNNG